MKVRSTAKTNLSPDKCVELGYYYRADRPKLDDADWHVFTGSQYDATTGEWDMSKLPVHHIV